MSLQLNAFLKDKGIIHQCTISYTQQQNGLAERKNRSLMDMARCMLNGKKLPHKFWLEAVLCANYVFNRNVDHMRIFGSLAYAFVLSQQRHKIEDKTTKYI